MRTPYHLMGSHCHPMGTQCHIWGPNITLWGLNVIYRVPLSPMGIFMPPYRAPLPPYGVPVTPMGPRCPQAPNNTDTKRGGHIPYWGSPLSLGPSLYLRPSPHSSGSPLYMGGIPAHFGVPPWIWGRPPPLSAVVLWSHRAAPAPGSAPGPGSWGGGGHKNGVLGPPREWGGHPLGWGLR